MKRGEYFRKYNIFEVDFDSEVCISMGCIHKKEYMTSHPSFILRTSIFVQKSLKMGQNGPLYREVLYVICISILITDMKIALVENTENDLKKTRNPVKPG